MTKKNVLVVANLTAVSDELLAALESLAAAHPAAFTLIAPASPAWGQGDADRERLAAALERLRAAGLEVDGRIGDSDPIVAVSEAWDPRRHDEIVVSTLPMPVSKWLHAGLPKRIADLTGALVTHVISRPRPHVEVAPVPPHPKSALGPLSVLGWGHSEHP
jgi:GABA permease